MIASNGLWPKIPQFQRDQCLLAEYVVEHRFQYGFFHANTQRGVAILVGYRTQSIYPGKPGPYPALNTVGFESFCERLSCYPRSRSITGKSNTVARSQRRTSEDCMLVQLHLSVQLRGDPGFFWVGYNTPSTTLFNNILSKTAWKEYRSPRWDKTCPLWINTNDYGHLDRTRFFSGQHLNFEDNTRFRFLRAKALLRPIRGTLREIYNDLQIMHPCTCKFVIQIFWNFLKFRTFRLDPGSVNGDIQERLR